MIETKDFTNNYLLILEESFESPSQDGAVYLDKGTGWFQTLDGLSAAQASQVFPGGTMTVAGQVNHAKFYLDTLDGYMTGRITGKTDWRKSWQVHEVTKEAWETLKREFKTTYEHVKTNLKNKQVWDDDSIWRFWFIRRTTLER
jgi:hypothetical protein